MTSIVNFDEKIRSSSNLTDEFFDKLNRLHEAKISGALKEDELSKLLICEGKLFSNLVRKGYKTEKDVESYENNIPSGEYQIGNYNHKDISVAKSTIKQTNTVALFDAETLNKRTQMVESYSKGLKM